MKKYQIWPLTSERELMTYENTCNFPSFSSSASNYCAANDLFDFSNFNSRVNWKSNWNYVFVVRLTETKCDIFIRKESNQPKRSQILKVSSGKKYFEKMPSLLAKVFILCGVLHFSISTCGSPVSTGLGIMRTGLDVALQASVVAPGAQLPLSGLKA